MASLRLAGFLVAESGRLPGRARILTLCEPRKARHHLSGHNNPFQKSVGCDREEIDIELSGFFQFALELENIVKERRGVAPRSVGRHFLVLLELWGPQLARALRCPLEIACWQCVKGTLTT